ncbi:Protein N-acetyltransferase, RimJ/RimL family [Rathayibacter oskolensis]|uniref:Protein N-acetyltransferase, RimJ/RimL family n=1 Tax=Rathayibacter oskolensis TaxID=1891671 RepID=A0A1X7NX50_9MICO|nr:GNAT family N-acetyltransferase [Rathayibacter oskolensis]SMH42935.1 Protein N-acetyltransferase, RimJ/RimL family [Rathayibacter oskolensis]
MNIQDANPEPVELRSERLRLRPWQVADAAFHRRLWEERDERVPAQRRITADGHPTIAEMQMWLRGYEQIPAPGLFVVEQLGTAEPVGYCGLVENSVGHPEEPELAFEFLRESWGRGFATEASRVVIDLVSAVGYDSLASTVREWNTASLNVLDKLGFVITEDKEHDAAHGDSLLLRLHLRRRCP